MPVQRGVRLITVAMTFAMLALAVGCTRTMPLKYTPVAVMESLQPSAREVKVAIPPVIDERKDKEVIASVGNNRVVTKDDVRPLVAGAMADVIRRAGGNADMISSINAEGAEAAQIPPNYDALMIGKLTTFHADCSSGWSNVNCTGKVVLEYRVVTRGGGSSDAWHGPVVGESVTEVPVVMWTEVPNFTDSALQHCMLKLISDLNQSNALHK